jgi:hypothetical protein
MINGQKDSSTIAQNRYIIYSSVNTPRGTKAHIYDILVDLFNLYL